MQGMVKRAMETPYTELDNIQTREPNDNVSIMIDGDFIIRHIILFINTFNPEQLYKLSIYFIL